MLTVTITLLLAATSCAKITEFSDTPSSCATLNCPPGNTCMEFPEGAFCWPLPDAPPTNQQIVRPAIETSKSFDEAPIRESCATMNVCDAWNEVCEDTASGPTCTIIQTSIPATAPPTTTTTEATTQQPWTTTTAPIIVTTVPTISRQPWTEPATTTAPIISTTARAQDAAFADKTWKVLRAPSTCDRVKCPPGEKCVIREVKCSDGKSDGTCYIPFCY